VQEIIRKFILAWMPARLFCIPQNEIAPLTAPTRQQGDTTKPREVIMATKIIQGQSDNTEYKERGIAASLKVSLDLSSTNRKYTHWHIDLNAGCGINDLVGCIGSPLAFIQQAELTKANYRAFFVDINESAIERLEQGHIANNPRCYSFHCDNREVLPVIAEMIKSRERNYQYAWGTVIVDPNGYFGKELPHEQLIEFAHQFPRMDLIFNLNIRIYQCGKGHIDRKEPGWINKFWPSIEQFPEVFNRKHWLIRHVIGTKARFALLVGRTKKTGDHRSLKLVQMNSHEGVAVLDQIERRDPNAEKQTDFLSPLQDLSGVSEPSNLQSSQGRSYETGERNLRSLRKNKSNQHPSQAVLPLGTV
jgi:hypothetical protein